MAVFLTFLDSDSSDHDVLDFVVFVVFDVDDDAVMEISEVASQKTSNEGLLEVEDVG